MAWLPRTGTVANLSQPAARHRRRAQDFSTYVPIGT